MIGSSLCRLGEYDQVIYAQTVEVASFLKALKMIKDRISYLAWIILEIWNILRNCSKYVHPFQPASQPAGDPPNTYS